MTRCSPVPLAATALATLITSAVADDGMWTFDHPPVDLVKQRYGVALTPDMLARLQQAAVNYGASASFVSKDGLLLTNHHVALSCIEPLSTRERDLLYRHINTNHGEPDQLPIVIVAREDGERVARLVAKGSPVEGSSVSK